MELGEPLGRGRDVGTEIDERLLHLAGDGGRAFRRGFGEQELVPLPLRKEAG